MVAMKPIDFRKGHDSLAAVVKNELRKDPFTGTVFVFRAKRRTDVSCSTGTMRRVRKQSSGLFPQRMDW